jgi:hypothetical protein
MSDDKAAINKDLMLHLAERIDTMLGDYVERASMVDISSETMARSMLTVLTQNVVLLSVSPPIAANEIEFLRMCGWHYRMEKTHG